MAPSLVVMALACGDASGTTSPDTAPPDTEPEDRIEVVDMDSLCASREPIETEYRTTVVRLDDYCVVYRCAADEREWCAIGVSDAYRCYRGCGVINYVADADESGFHARTFSLGTGELVGAAGASDTALFCNDSFAIYAGGPEPPPWSDQSCSGAIEVPCCQVR